MFNQAKRWKPAAGKAKAAPVMDMDMDTDTATVMEAAMVAAEAVTAADSIIVMEAVTKTEPRSQDGVQSRKLGFRQSGGDLFLNELWRIRTCAYLSIEQIGEAVMIRDDKSDGSVAKIYLSQIKQNKSTRRKRPACFCDR